MNDWKFGDVIQRDMGKLIVMVCGDASPNGGYEFEDGYVMRSDPGWGITLKNDSIHQSYPLHKTCVIATPENWEKVE